MKPISRFITIDMHTTGLRVDIKGALAEGHFAEDLEASRKLGEMLREEREAKDARWTITPAGKAYLDGKK